MRRLLARIAGLFVLTAAGAFAQTFPFQILATSPTLGSNVVANGQTVKALKLALTHQLHPDWRPQPEVT